MPPGGFTTHMSSVLSPPSTCHCQPTYPQEPAAAYNTGVTPHACIHDRDGLQYSPAPTERLTPAAQLASHLQFAARSPELSCSPPAVAVSV